MSAPSASNTISEALSSVISPEAGLIVVHRNPFSQDIHEIKEYKNPIDGIGLFQGVMSDEIPQEAVINNGEYDMVNYNMLDVEFKQI